MVVEVVAYVVCVCCVGTACIPPHHTPPPHSAHFPADPFFYEFFLTHPVFISLERICSILKATYRGSYQHSGERETQIVVMTDDGSEPEEVDGVGEEEGSTEATKRK